MIRIMTGHLVQKIDFRGKLLLGAVAFVSLAVPVALGLSANLDTAQTLSPSGNPATTNNDAAVDLPPLAVASIRQVAFADNDPQTILFSDDGASFRNVPVAWIIQLAFSSQPSVFSEDGLILGCPSWTKSEHYNIEAKVDDEDVPKWKALSASQRRLALQPLLVTRFNLQFHHETRERPTYSLVIAKTWRDAP